MKAKTYRSRIVEVEAILFDGTKDCANVIINWVGGGTYQPYEQVNSQHFPPILYVPTPEGVSIASVGDYVIKGTIGEFYPCKPEVFNHRYDEADAET